MRTILIALFIVPVTSAICTPATPAPKDWLLVPNVAFTEEHRLSEAQFAEVRITRLMTAVDRLKDKSAIPLSEELAKYYAGVMFKTEKGFTPFLVRGLFANNTGQFSIFGKMVDSLLGMTLLEKTSYRNSAP